VSFALLNRTIRLIGVVTDDGMYMGTKDGSRVDKLKI
jgi:hypothetical protein